MRTRIFSAVIALGSFFCVESNASAQVIVGGSGSSSGTIVQSEVIVQSSPIVYSRPVYSAPVVYRPAVYPGGFYGFGYPGFGYSYAGGGSFANSTNGRFGTNIGFAPGNGFGGYSGSTFGISFNSGRRR